MLGKMNGYSTALAQTKFEEGRRATLVGAVLHGAWAFFSNLHVLRGRVSRRREGFHLAVANAEGSYYYRYVKLCCLFGKRDLDLGP